MTTIIAAQGKGLAVLVGDQSLTGDLKHPDMPKVVSRHTWVAGAAGDARVCDELLYLVPYPDPSHLVQDVQEWLPFMITEVVPAIKDTVGERECSWSLLLVSHGHAWLIESDYSVSYADPYWAIGSGGQVALGALSALAEAKPKMPVYARVEQAMQTAQKYDHFSRGKTHGFLSKADGSVIALQT